MIVKQLQKETGSNVTSIRLEPGEVLWVERPQADALAFSYDGLDRFICNDVDGNLIMEENFDSNSGIWYTTWYGEATIHKDQIGE